VNLRTGDLGALGCSVPAFQREGELSYILALLDDLLILVRLLQEELRIQIRLCNRFMIDDRERANAGQDEVLRYLICEGFNSDKENIGGPDPVGC
jgi:hypothetical protein